MKTADFGEKLQEEKSALSPAPGGGLGVMVCGGWMKRAPYISSGSCPIIASTKQLLRAPLEDIFPSLPYSYKKGCAVNGKRPSMNNHSIFAGLHLTGIGCMDHVVIFTNTASE